MTRKQGRGKKKVNKWTIYIADLGVKGMANQCYVVVLGQGTGIIHV